jgi:hypothetical protein
VFYVIRDIQEQHPSFSSRFKFEADISSKKSLTTQNIRFHNSKYHTLEPRLISNGRNIYLRTFILHKFIAVFIPFLVLENVKYFKCLGKRTTHYTRRKSNIKSRIAMEKQCSTRRISFYQKIGLKLKEETSKVLHLEHSFVWWC